jgi:aminocarboxymuconate-semialdehyde decarboxylase
MRSIDIHTHVLPPELPRWVGFMRIERVDACRARMVREDGTVFREIESNCWDPKERLRECDEAGVEVQVLSTVPAMLAYQRRGDDLARFLNDHLASLCREYPKRFLGLGTLPL